MEKITRLFDFAEEQLTQFPKKDMLACKESNGHWRKFSSAEVTDIVNRLSEGLLRLGLSGNDLTVERQDKVAIISRNRPEWLFLDMACQQIGVILVPVYPTSNPAELQFIFNDAAVKYLFCSGQELWDKMQAIKPNVPSLREVYSFDELPGCAYWTSLLNHPPSPKVAELRQTINSETCATIIYTSGTTGTPKGVMLSHRNIVSNIFNSVKSFPFERQYDDARALSFLPLNHIFERLISYLYIHSGISIYFAESMETIGDNLKEVRPMVFCTVPRLLEKVYEKIMAKGNELTGVKKSLFDWAIRLGNEYDNRESKGLLYNLQLNIANKLVFSKWREALGNHIQYIITGSAACQVRLLRIFNAARIPVYEGYGPTENSPVISVNRRGKDGTKYGTVGPVLEGQELRLEPDGEICVKGPSVMMGYYKRPDLTAEVIKDGWLYTGDIGVLEDGKFLRITDRKKELFKTSGGKYVAPQPIENKMKESMFIEQVMVVGANMKFTGALIVPAFAHLRTWMEQHSLTYTSAEEVIQIKEVKDLFREEVEKMNAFFNHIEQVKKFALLPREWTVESGELTPTLKLKRKIILEKNQAAMEEIYG